MIDLRCLINGHIPTELVRRFEDAIMGSRYIGRDENYDKNYEDIICKFCGQRIHTPGLLKEMGTVAWEVYKREDLASGS